MSALRPVARRLLRFSTDHCSAASREWGEAMLHELDVIDGDWDALWWALGGSVAVCRVIPMSLHFLGVMVLWRARRRMAFGVLAAGVVLVAHAIAHYVAYG
ncbi:MAG: hypothetical protein ACREPM_25635 [Gemmatimonadaceae bacterium]